jgi:hypothetical protein
MERKKYKCRYCNKLITVKGGMCSECKEKLDLVRKLLRMEYVGKKDGGNRDKL